MGLRKCQAILVSSGKDWAQSVKLKEKSGRKMSFFIYQKIYSTPMYGRHYARYWLTVTNEYSSSSFPTEWSPYTLVAALCLFSLQSANQLHLSFCISQFSSESESQVTQLCPTLCDPMNCSLPGSSVHGIFQARILEWVAISFSRKTS